MPGGVQAELPPGERYSRGLILALCGENYEGPALNIACFCHSAQELHESIEQPALCLAQSGRMALKASRPACSS